MKHLRARFLGYATEGSTEGYFSVGDILFGDFPRIIEGLQLTRLLESKHPTWGFAQIIEGYL